MKQFNVAFQLDVLNNCAELLIPILFSNTSSISVSSNETKNLLVCGFGLEKANVVRVASIIGSNPVFIVGNNEYNVASLVGNNLYTAIFYYKFTTLP